MPFVSNLRMASLYCVRTRLLSAFGFAVFESHQTRVKASFTRQRSTVTHCAGVGSFAGLKQTNSWHRWKFPAFLNARSASIASVDIVG